MRILICGDRNWTNKDLIIKIIQDFLKSSSISTIIEGEAKGADSLAREVAEELNIPVLQFPANWDKFGKSAGMIRNKQMLNEGKPDLIIAFHNDFENSKGTKNMISLATKSGIDYLIIHE